MDCGRKLTSFLCFWVALFLNFRMLTCWTAAVSTQQDVQHFYYRMTSADGRCCLVQRTTLRQFDSAGHLVTVSHVWSLWNNACVPAAPEINCYIMILGVLYVICT
jgi:hypothetical protein